MTKRLVGIAILLLLGFTLFVFLAGFGMLIAAVFLVMHPAVIIFGTVLSSFMVLLHLMTKDKKQLTQDSEEHIISTSQTRRNTNA